jgi:hypothetical protein
MLVDAQGKIAYDVEGMDEDELRKEIAKLGPEIPTFAIEAKADSMPGLEVIRPSSTRSKQSQTTESDSFY